MMNIIDALNSRYCCRRYSSDPVSKETVLKILDAAVRAPSWANTQPWEIYVAAGEVLERLRRAYLSNHEKEVGGNPDLPRLAEWPPAMQKRIEDLMAERSMFLGHGRDDQAARQDLMLAKLPFFRRTRCDIFVHGSHPHLLVDIRSWLVSPKHYARGKKLWAGHSACSHVSYLPRSDTLGTGNPRYLVDHHWDSTRIR